MKISGLDIIMMRKASPRCTFIYAWCTSRFFLVQKNPFQFNLKCTSDTDKCNIHIPGLMINYIFLLLQKTSMVQDRCSVNWSRRHQIQTYFAAISKLLKCPHKEQADSNRYCPSMLQSISRSSPTVVIVPGTRSRWASVGWSQRHKRICRSSGSPI